MHDFGSNGARHELCECPRAARAHDYCITPCIAGVGDNLARRGLSIPTVDCIANTALIKDIDRLLQRPLSQRREAVIEMLRRKRLRKRYRV